MTARRGSALALLMFVLTPCVSFCAEQWTEIRSPNFDIITDAGEKRGREAAFRFEQMRAAFDHIFTVKVSTPIPLQIVAFRNNKELSHFAPLWKGKPIELAGFFVPGEDRQFIALELTSTEGYEIAFHEYTHLLVHATVGQVPLWMDEGLAEYLSTLKMDKEHIYYGDVPVGRSYVLGSNRWMKIEQLFSVQHESAEYNERGDHRSMFYAESWLVMHYLMSTNTLHNAFVYKRLVMEQHLHVADAVQRAFGMTPAEFDKALDAYVHHGGKKWSVPGAQVAPVDSYTAHSISEIDADAILADLHLHEPDYGAQAVTEFQQVLEKQPNNAIAHRGLGYALLRKGDYQQAEQHLKTAIASGGTDARTHYLYALLLTRKGFGPGQGTVMISNSADIDLAELKKESQAAIALDPSFADAYNLLAYALAREQDFQGAVASETKAFQLDPHKDVYALNLAQYQAQAHNLDEAERLLKALMNSRDPIVVANAQNYLQRVQTQRNFEDGAHNAPAASPPMQSFQPSSGTASSKSSPPPPPANIQFVKGKIVKVDCSTPPGASVAVMVEKKLWSMTTPNRDKLILIGADSFSCEWHNRNVAVNFREVGNNAGEIVSLELQ